MISSASARALLLLTSFFLNTSILLLLISKQSVQCSCSFFTPHTTKHYHFQTKLQHKTTPTITNFLINPPVPTASPSPSLPKVSISNYIYTPARPGPSSPTISIQLLHYNNNNKFLNVCLLDHVRTQSSGRVIYPIGYGADPTGAQDSSSAISEAVNNAVKLQNGLDLLPGIADLGGVTIDLQGGNFRISSPIRFPPHIANIVVR